MKDARPTGKLVLKKTDAEDGSLLPEQSLNFGSRSPGKLLQPW